MINPTIPGAGERVSSRFGFRSFRLRVGALVTAVLFCLTLSAGPGADTAVAATKKPASNAKKPASNAKKPTTRKAATARKAPAKRTTTAKRRTTTKRATAKKRTTTAKRARTSKRRVATRSARFRGQKSPTTDRFREIQQALQTAGYFEAEPSGKWDESSVAAMKRFQDQHSIPATGKINSLSLIALGLGPKRGPAPGTSSVLESPQPAVAAESNDRE